MYTVIRCHCPATRREAIKLLGKDLPREGLWESEQHRIVAERVIEVQEVDVDAKDWPAETSRLCRSSLETEVDEEDGFLTRSRCTKDLDLAAKRVSSERLFLGESPRKTVLSLLLHMASIPISQQPCGLLFRQEMTSPWRESG